MPSPMTRADIEQMFATFQAANPHPETELEYSSPFELLTAVLLRLPARQSHSRTTGERRRDAALFRPHHRALRRRALHVRIELPS